LKLNFEILVFYESGKLEVGALAEDTTINGIKYYENDLIGWDEQGKFLGKTKWDSEKDISFCISL